MLVNSSKWEVILNREEGLAAAERGADQQISTFEEGRQWDHGGRSKRSLRLRWADSIHGAMAEAAMSKLLDLPVTPGEKGKITYGDIGGFIEIRSTEWKNGNLIIYERDPVDVPFILVVGHYPRFKAVGFVINNDIDDKWWRSDKDPASWWIPQSALSPMRDFKYV